MSLNQWINFIILLILVVIFVLRSKEKKLSLLFLFILIVVYWIYYRIGNWLHTDVPIAFYFHKNGVAISFIGSILLIVTSMLVMGVLAKLFGFKSK